MTFSWQLKNRQQKRRRTHWVILFIIIGLSLLILGLVQKNFIFIVLVLLSLFMFYRFNKISQVNMSFLINQQGVTIDKTLYPYDHLKSFWIFYAPGGRQELSLESKKNIMPYIRIPLGNQNPKQIRDWLLQYLPEKEQEESLVDVIAHRLRF